MKYYALDFETSGLDAKRHWPVQLGFVVMDRENVIEEKEWIISPPMKNGLPTREYNLVSLEISGLKWPEIKRGRTTSSIVEEIRAITAKHGALPIVSHNSVFDQGFWSEVIYSCGSWNYGKFMQCVDPLVGPWYCTRRMAGPLELEDGRLDTVSAHFGLSRTTELHGALEDAILCGRIFARLVKEEAHV